MTYTSFKKIVCAALCGMLLFSAVPAQAGWFDTVKNWFTPKAAVIAAAGIGLTALFAWIYGKKKDKKQDVSQAESVPMPEVPPFTPFAPVTDEHDRALSLSAASSTEHAARPTSGSNSLDQLGSSNWQFQEGLININDLVELARIADLKIGFEFNLTKSFPCSQARVQTSRLIDRGGALVMEKLQDYKLVAYNGTMDIGVYKVLDLYDYNGNPFVQYRTKRDLFVEHISGQIFKIRFTREENSADAHGLGMWAVEQFYKDCTYRTQIHSEKK